MRFRSGREIAAPDWFVRALPDHPLDGELWMGRYTCMIGALQVRTPQVVVFALGSGLSDAQRRNPPEVGSWVTYRYRGRTTQSVPHFATFVRVRPEE